MTDIVRLKQRKQFLAVAKGAYRASPHLVVQALKQEPPSESEPILDLIRSGFTATKKTGNAVKRNRAKRRLREVARQTLPKYGKAGYDYVFIARPSTISAKWQALLDEAKRALIKLAAP